MTEPRVATVPETAEMLRVSEDLVLKWLDNGILPEVLRVSRRRLIPRQAIEDLIDQSMRGWDAATAAARLKDTG